MPVLSNPRHELFAQELAKGKTAEEAHGLAGYRANRGNASVLKQEQSIVDRVAELLTEREQVHAQSTLRAVEAVSLTKAWVLEQMIDNALVSSGKKTITLKVKPRGSELPVEVEVNMRDASAANRALELLGKELGMFVDRKEIGQPGDFASMNDGELLDKIKERAQLLGVTVPKHLHS